MRKSVFVLGSLVASAVFAFGCAPDETEEGGTAQAQVDANTEKAARANLLRVEAEIDKNHLANYQLEGALADRFIAAVKAEYSSHPQLLEARMRTLASMVFFSAPEVTTDAAAGKVTPFHGMNDAAFENLMTNEDTVFNHHMQVNGGSPNGVRPFSVCETTYLIKISKNEINDPAFVSNGRISAYGYDAYAKAFKDYAASCAQRDLDEWYNFRGLGGLRPSWLESNLSDRFLRRMVKQCAKSNEGDCAAWNKSRIDYRDRKNTELALREMVYDPRPETMIGSPAQSMERYLLSPSNPGVLVEDANGDGVGEWIPTGPVTLKEGTALSIPTASQFRAPADIKVTLASALTIDNHVLKAGDAVTLRSGSYVGFASSEKYDPNAHAPIVFAAGDKIRLVPGTQVAFEDGTTGWVPNVAGQPVSKQTQAKLTTEVRLDVAPAWTPTLRIGKPKSGVLAANSFAGQLEVPIKLADNSEIVALVDSGAVVAQDAVDPKWKKEFLAKPDFGLLDVFPDGGGCNGAAPNKESCPLLKRYFSLIDRHENFYQTYSGLAPESEVVSQQPSPLVACSITLRASHAWDHAGTPTGGTAGFIYLMRIPFDQILSADQRSISTLGLLDSNGDKTAGPRVATIENIYKGVVKLDMSKAWLDIATLSSNAYQSEHEVSKFGSVPAEQIEGILVIRRPAKMNGGVDPGAQPGG